MKKWVCYSILTFLFAMGSFGSEYSVGENVTEMAVMHDYAGGAYVLYVQDGRLKAIHEDSKGQIEPYSLSRLDAGNHAVHSLHIKEDAGKNIGSFIANNGQLFLLSLEVDNEIYFHQLPINVSDEIENLVVDASDSEELEIFYIEKGDIINWIVERGTYTVVSKNILNIKGDCAIEFVSQSKADNIFGFFITQATNYEYKVTLFKRNSANLFFTYEITGLSERPTARLYINIDNQAFFSLVTQNETQIFYEQNTYFTKIFEHPGVKEIDDLYVSVGDKTDILISYTDKVGVSKIGYGNNTFSLTEMNNRKKHVFVPTTLTKIFVLYNDTNVWVLMQSDNNKGTILKNEVDIIPVDSELYSIAYIDSLHFLFINHDLSQIFSVLFSEDKLILDKKIDIPENIRIRMKSVSIVDPGLISSLYTSGEEILLIYKNEFLRIDYSDGNMVMIPFDLISSSSCDNNIVYVSYVSSDRLVVDKYGANQ